MTLSEDRMVNYILFSTLCGAWCCVLELCGRIFGQSHVVITPAAVQVLQPKGHYSWHLLPTKQEILAPGHCSYDLSQVSSQMTAGVWKLQMAG